MPDTERAGRRGWYDAFGRRAFFALDPERSHRVALSMLALPLPWRRIGHAVAGLLAPGTALLGAPEGAAMLLVAAVSLETGLPVTVVRKEPKAYGTRAQVEGEVAPGAVTTLVEDVSTTGHQVRRAAEVLTEAGADVRRIVLAIDRGGAEHLREAGYDVGAVAVLRPAE